MPCFPTALPLGKLVPLSPASLVARGVRWATIAVSPKPTLVTPADLALTGLSGQPKVLSVQTSALATLERLAAGGLTAISCVDMLLSSVITALVDLQADSTSFLLWEDPDVDSVRMLVTALSKGIGQCAQSLGSLYADAVVLWLESLLVSAQAPRG